MRIRLNNRLLRCTAPFALGLLAKGLRATISFKTDGLDLIKPRWEKGMPSIYALWHQRMLMLPFSYSGPGASVLVSTHRDGELIARVLPHLGLNCVRGSTTRGGSSGFRQMVEVLQSGHDVAITPDGPRGPKHVVQAGVIALAKMTGLPIFPVTYACSRCWRLNSWDNFVIPAPFSKGIFIYGEPLTAPDNADDDQAELLRAELERRLVSLTDRAEATVGNADYHNPEKA